MGSKVLSLVLKRYRKIISVHFIILPGNINMKKMYLHETTQWTLLTRLTSNHIFFILFFLNTFLVCFYNSEAFGVGDSIETKIKQILLIF